MPGKIPGSVAGFLVRALTASIYIRSVWQFEYHCPAFYNSHLYYTSVSYNDERDWKKRILKKS